MEKHSDKETALLAAARREAASRRTGSNLSGVDTAAPRPPAEKARPGPAERLAMLMAEERAETERRRKKMRRYGIMIPAATVAIFALWVLRSSSRRR